MKRFYYFVYQFLIVLFFPLISLFLVARVVGRPEYREGIRQRFGRYPNDFFKPIRGKKVFWVHAVSVGEVISAGFFLRSLRERYPECAVVFSTVTPAGRAAARNRLAGVDLFIYFPFDLIWVTRSVIRKVAPTLFIFLETEIWPSFLFSLSEKKIPALLLNGRISERGFRRYRRVRFFLRHVLDEVALFLMQTERDVDRILALGAPKERVERTGNMKYDQAGAGRPAKAPSRSDVGLQEEETLIIAGSTHVGEEEAVLDAYETLTRSGAGPAALLIAPRHLDRLSDVERLISERGYVPARKSALAGARKSQRTDKTMTFGEWFEVERKTILLLDTMGELEHLYPLADLIFVGGSLAPVGGHNVLEAAACRKPIFFGPHMDNFHEIADQLKRSGGGVEVLDGKDLGQKMAWMIRRPEEYKKRGESAYQVVIQNRGAVARNLERVARWAEKNEF
ncbi:MAG TPA: glycosyltransferase N-terminal domain-containing protein [Candidatus Manganitrophaceae bacterium]|nr:glycosyltransferase N-terminal domain-containing protein [Candidatus Manganitrophaceae bacterium]